MAEKLLKNQMADAEVGECGKNDRRQVRVRRGK